MKPVLVVVFVAFSFFITSCAGGKKGGDEGKEVSISGKLLAPDGKTPVANATVYIPAESSASALTAKQGDTCEEPKERYIAWTCTDKEGKFSLKATISGKAILKFKKGVFEMYVAVDRDVTNLGNVKLPSDPQKGAPKIAVATGDYDRMEDVLAKLGFGEIDDQGRLKLSTEKFDLYDGNDSLGSNYPEFLDLFRDKDGDGKPDIYKYDIVFINCGNSYERDVFSDQQKVKVLRQYVADGGRLYVTDLSYDFVEQSFPEFIDFYGSDSTPEADPETPGAAEVGNSGSTKGDVLDPVLKEWLKVVDCQNSSGSDVPCLDPSDNKVHIEGFLGSWAVVNGTHPGKASAVKVWVKGNVSYSYPSESGEKPLTLTFDFQKGRVLYTSYHTESANIKGFLPQERILQYLVFF